MAKIPNKIHWCWLSNDPLPDNVREIFLPSWKKMGEDYEIKLWNTENFDIRMTPKFIRDAYDDKHYAMVSDYIRAYAVYMEGGWYFDSDIEIKRPFPEEWRNHNLCATFEATEYTSLLLSCLDDEGKNKTGVPIWGAGINTAMFGGVAKLKYLYDVMAFYNTLDYSKLDYEYTLLGRYIAPQIYSFVAEKYGYKYDNSIGTIDDDMFIAPEILVTNVPYSRHNNLAYAHHHCNFGWGNKIPSKK